VAGHGHGRLISNRGLTAVRMAISQVASDRQGRSNAL
jgi:hypothetical protein